MADQVLDCKYKKCPAPLIMLSKSIKLLASGQTLKVEATDPAFKNDLEAWVKKLGHNLLEFTDGEVKKAIIRKV